MTNISAGSAIRASSASAGWTHNRTAYVDFGSDNQAAANTALAPPPPTSTSFRRLSPVPRRAPRTDHDMWATVRREARALARSDPAMASFASRSVLDHDRLEDAIARRTAQRLATPEVSADTICDGFHDALVDNPSIAVAMRTDLAAVVERDPACARYIEPLLYFKGYQALQAHRLAHWLWNHHRQDFALWLQGRCSEVFQTDISPAACLGKWLFLDHATGLVIGSTAVVDDDVSILHDVTLGGTGKESGDRHPKIRRGVLIGAGAKILGNIVVGACAKVAAGSVVLHPVPANTTVAGVPAKVVGGAGRATPAHSMDHMLTTEA